MKIDMKGFTLLEVIIAVSILGSGIAASVALINRTIALGFVVRNQLIGANLAQEGIEIVHNIRHTNWIKQRSVLSTPWDAGLIDGNSCVNFNSKILSDAGFTAGGCNLPAERQLYFVTNRYIHSLIPSGITTPFSRHIEISHGIDTNGTPLDSLDDKPFALVKSIVIWDQGTISAEERLYDWK